MDRPDEYQDGLLDAQCQVCGCPFKIKLSRRWEAEEKLGLGACYLPEQVSVTFDACYISSSDHKPIDGQKLVTTSTYRLDRVCIDCRTLLATGINALVSKLRSDMEIKDVETD